MNILWITNNLMPELAEETGLEGSPSGTWLIDISQKLSGCNDINLAVATVGGNEFKKLKIGNITYYLLPGTGKNMIFYTKRFESLWRHIKNDFSVDLVHLHGTEYTHGLAFLRANPEVKAVVSVQGIISRIGEVYLDGLPKWFFIKYRTFAESLRLNGTYEKRLLYKHNSRYEKEIFRRVNYANVVNAWDESVTKAFNPDIKTFRIEYNLRDSFYKANKWDVSRVQKRQIFTNPGGDPIKGLHIFCKALGIVKKAMPNVRAVVPGIASINGRIKISSGYTKYISHLIKENNIEENIKFVGRLNEQQMLENMLEANVVVVPSAMEGTSLVLREAMYIGAPCIASFRGGMADFVRDKENGFLYDFPEYALLAARIMQIFNDDALAMKLSQNAILQAEKAHDRDKNFNDYLSMYDTILKEE